METMLPCGKIVNTHGVRGEVKIEPWCEEDFFPRVKTVYLDGRAHRVLGSRMHKGFVLARLEGVDTLEAAQTLKNKELLIRRDEVTLPKGRYFLQDILGFAVYDGRVGRALGTLARVDELPGGRMYVVRQSGAGEGAGTAGRTVEILIPVEPFGRGVDFATKRVLVETIEGMLPDEN